MAHKKGASSTRNGRDSNPQYLGVKRFGGQVVKAGEILALRLLTLNNLHFYLDLMRQARAAIAQGRFPEFKDEAIARYRACRLP